MRLTVHLDACADALTLNGGSGDAHFIELLRALSPTGRIPRGVVVSPTPRQ